MLSAARDGDPFYEILVSGLRGGVPAICAALERALDLGYEPADFYADPDLGPVLRGADYEAFRARHTGFEELGEGAEGDVGPESLGRG